MNTPSQTGSMELSIVVPTFNERSNILELLSRLQSTLGALEWEVLFVDDDSPDGTADFARNVAQSDRRVRVLHRVGRRGLSSACIEGMLASSAPIIAVMDADLQHDESRLPLMLQRIQQQADIVVATRYAAGGGIGDWDATRAGMSRIATVLGRYVVRQHVSDPMSGFFMLRRAVLDETVHGLSGLGFKILLDILATAKRPLQIVEVPFTFRPRHSGESKLDSVAVWDYLMLLLDKKVGAYVPARFVMFALVGLAGTVVHMLVLASSMAITRENFLASQAAATASAMVFNYAVNNALTYRDKRLRGWRWLRGLVSFVALCGIGAIANVGVANYFFVSETPWAAAALAGIAVGAVWNFAITQIYTWGQSGR